MHPVTRHADPDQYELSWHEIEHLLTVVWDSAEQCDQQAAWLEQLGWRVHRLDRQPVQYDGSTVHAVVLHPSQALSPGSLRFRPPADGDTAVLVRETAYPGEAYDEPAPPDTDPDRWPADCRINDEFARSDRPRA